MSKGKNPWQGIQETWVGYGRHHTRKREGWYKQFQQGLRPKSWQDKSIKLGYLQISPYRWWKFMWSSKDYCGIFRNHPEVVKWIPGKVLPRRWGFYILGLEIGDRG